MTRETLCALVLLAAMSSCKKEDTPKPGRTWVTPPLEQADGGIVGQKLPRVLYRGGPFLRNPQIVTITFKGDDPQTVARMESFGDVITRGQWWRAVVDSYCAKPNDCIGYGQPGVHVKLEQAMAGEVSDNDLYDMLVREANGGRFGSLGPNSLLMLYLPPSVTLTSAAVKHFCSGGPRALHRALDLGKVKVPFAVLPRCSDEAELTGAASHEVLEATTNPDPSNRGFAFDSGTSSLGFVSSGLEPVDPCGLLTMDDHWTVEDGFSVQRGWSNRAAAAGHEPCVPARPGRPYVALVPTQPALRLAKDGETGTVTLEAAGDQPVPPWSISAFDLFGYQDHDRYVEASLDRSSIAAGEKATLTVKMLKRHPKQVAVVALVSTLGVHSHMWPLPIVMR